MEVYVFIMCIYFFVNSVCVYGIWVYMLMLGSEINNFTLTRKLLPLSQSYYALILYSLTQSFSIWSNVQIILKRIISQVSSIILSYFYYTVS